MPCKATQGQSEQPGTVGGRLCMHCYESRVPPGSHRRMWLACLNNSVSWPGTETHYLRVSRNCLVPLIKE